MNLPINSPQIISSLKKENAELKNEIELLKLFATRIGFFQYYFTQLAFYKTKKECFDAVNEQYFDLLNEYRYEDYNSFRKQVNNIKN